MDTKLTLKLDQAIIEQAKRYANAKNISLSKLIESYLEKLVVPAAGHEITPLVKSLSGVCDPPKNYDYRKEYKKHISRKYGK